MRRNRPESSDRHLSVLTAALVAAAAIAAACSGSNGGTGSVGPAAALLVTEVAPTSDDVWLNDRVLVTFNRQVLRDSLSLETLRCEPVDAAGQPIGPPVAGSFDLANNGELAVFAPRLPIGPAATHGGLQAGQAYRVQVVGGEVPNGAVVRDLAGTGLQASTEFRFTTRTGITPAELYRNLRAGGPRRVSLDVTTASSLDAVPLGVFGAPPLEVRLGFDQALDPSAANLPLELELDPRFRSVAQRGMLYLEYEDPLDAPGTYTWIPADVELERNDYDGAVVVLRPLGVLPNNATVRIIVEPEVQDLAGESNVGAVGYDRVFGTFRTAALWEQQWNAIVAQFANDVDPTAAFAEPQAEVGPGFLRASFAFEGEASTFDYTAPLGIKLLSTNLATLVPDQGEPRTFEGGVFALRNLTVPAGSVLEGQGSNPLVVLCSGQVQVAGTISVAGGNGVRGQGSGVGGQYIGPGDQVPGSMIPGGADYNGGIGRCGGGSGGAGSPGSQRAFTGAIGRGPQQQIGLGGRGGHLACVAGCYTGFGYNGSGGGSGGGGGSLATQGDPHYRGITPSNIVPNTAPTSLSAFQQVRGYGGTGCSGGSGTRTAFLVGGEPGPLVFTDTRADNDFWGSAYDPRRRLRITGELSAPIGGGGGGGGGDTSPQNNCSLTGGNPALDYRGGGGGAGGGVIVIKALGDIRITSTGRITADGGNGGGGEQVGASGESGGGGGGAGGMVVLVSATAIRIEAHGNPATNRYAYGSGAGGPFAGNDYDFAISADGGVCTTGGFGSLVLMRKYPASGQTMLPGTQYDGEPLGGLGGMGIVQLQAPTGDNSDGTNTMLDDNIHFYLPGQLSSPVLPMPIAAAGKRQLLAWRGLPNGFGAVDDFGNVVVIGNDEGDIRPAPLLLPSPLTSRSRARSRWLDTGRSDRRPLAAPDAGARGLVVGNGAVPGPRYEFAGTSPDTGFLSWEQFGNGAIRLTTPIVVPPTALAAASTDASFLGAPAYRLQLGSAVLGARDRYVGHDAELLDAAGAVLGRFRILAHDDRELLVATDASLPTQATQVRIAARFCRPMYAGVEGLPAYQAGALDVRPRANARIGFAFHTGPDPFQPLVGRYPVTGEDSFAYDLADPALQAWLAANQPRFVMWDVLFDATHDSGVGPAPFQPFAPRLELHDLRLPFRF